MLKISKYLISFSCTLCTWCLWWKEKFYHSRKTIIWYEDGCGDRTKIINGDGRNFAYVEIHTYTQQKSWNAI